MTRAALLAAALIATPAHADGFTDREIAYQALNAIDAVQTCRALHTGRGVELNPILGRRPSCGAVVGYKAAGGVVHYVLVKALNDQDPHAAKVLQIFSIVFQGGVVAANLRFVL